MMTEIGKGIKYHRREVWGANDPTDELIQLCHPLDYVIFTHTVITGNFATSEECIRGLQECQKIHMVDSKWADIGFNFLIGNNGTVYEGRGWDYQGATAKGWNTISMGIGFLGTYLDTMPSKEALEAAKIFIQYMVDKGILKQDFTIHCLRQVRTQFNQAPGDLLYREIQKWKGMGSDCWAWREVDYADNIDIPLAERLSDTHKTNMLSQRTYFQKNVKTPVNVLTILMEKGAISKARYNRIVNSSSNNDDVISRIIDVCCNGRKANIAMLIGALLETSQRLIANTVYLAIPKEERDCPSYQLVLHKTQVPSYTQIPPDQITFDEVFGEASRKVELGEGSFGVVFRGTYRALGNTKVAIKRVKGSEYAGLSKKDKRDFLKEASTMYTLRHPRIVTIYGVVCDDQCKLYCLVMEYMELGSLDRLLDEIQIPWPLKVSMLLSVSEGLMFLNNKQQDRSYTISHCDVKTRNILINEMFQAKVADFGEAVIQNITSRSIGKDSESAGGTVTHMAPELLDPPGNPPCYQPTEKSDVWSFGITVFEVCAENVQGTGERRTPFPRHMKPLAIIKMIGVSKESPFTKEQMKKLENYRCPQHLIELMEKCCTISPEGRPVFKDITAELAQYYESECQPEIHTALIQAHRLYQEKILGCKLHQDDPDDTFAEEYFYGVSHGESFDVVDMCATTSWENVRGSETGASGETSINQFQHIVQKATQDILHSQMNMEKKLSFQISQLSTSSVTEESVAIHGELIQANFEKLVEDIMFNNLKPHLIQNGALSMDDCERIEKAVTSRDQNMVLLRMIDRKGEECILKLAAALEEDGMEHLSQLLKC